MTNDEKNGARDTSARGRRIRNVSIGLAGVTALTGFGAFLTTGSTELNSLAKKTGTAELPAATELGEKAAAQAAQIAPSTSPTSLDERLDNARDANRRLGTAVRRPNNSSAVDASKVKKQRIGKTGKLIEVYSSPQDLTGYHALAWVRDGSKFRDAMCTQKITLSPDVPPRIRPTLLICWRTSAKKSAYTVAVDFDKNPSKDVSVTALEKAWNAIR